MNGFKFVVCVMICFIMILRIGLVDFCFFVCLVLSCLLRRRVLWITRRFVVRRLVVRCLVIFIKWLCGVENLIEYD